MAEDNHGRPEEVDIDQAQPEDHPRQMREHLRHMEDHLSQMTSDYVNWTSICVG